jgi:hypothetical protein
MLLVGNMLTCFYIVNGLQIRMQMQELDILTPYDFQKRTIVIM